MKTKVKLAIGMLLLAASLTTSKATPPYCEVDIIFVGPWESAYSSCTSGSLNDGNWHQLGDCWPNPCTVYTDAGTNCMSGGGGPIFIVQMKIFANGQWWPVSTVVKQQPDGTKGEARWDVFGDCQNQKVYVSPRFVWQCEEEPY